MGWLENRPFLRCLHGLALVKYEEGAIEEALRLFQELLSLNPNDNQGVRAMTQEPKLETLSSEVLLMPPRTKNLGTVLNVGLVSFVQETRSCLAP